MSQDSKKKGLLKKAIDPKDHEVSQMRFMAMIALYAAIAIIVLGLVLMKFIERLDCIGIAAVTSPLIVSAFTGKWLQKREEIKSEIALQEKEE